MYCTNWNAWSCAADVRAAWIWSMATVSAWRKTPSEAVVSPAAWYASARVRSEPKLVGMVEAGTCSVSRVSSARASSGRPPSASARAIEPTRMR